MRTSAEFSHAFRSGIRTGRRNIVVSTAKNPGKTTQVGFIVSKAVGNAVTRNLVKRRLRELAALTCAAHPEGYAIAVRALPASASASWDQLRRDYESALEAAFAKLDLPQSASTRITVAPIAHLPRLWAPTSCWH